MANMNLGVIKNKIDSFKLSSKRNNALSALLLTSDRLIQKSSIELSSEKIWKA